MQPRQTRTVTRTTKRPWGRFIELLAETGNVSLACRETGIPRRSAYVRRKRDTKFASAWDEAITTAVDLLEAEAKRRAMEGVLEPVFQQGRLVGMIRRFSDRLMILLLKAHKPDRYGGAPLFGRQAGHTGATIHFDIDLGGKEPNGND